MFFGVPTMYHRLAASSRVGELARLRLAVSGSAPLSAELHRAIAASAGVRGARALRDDRDAHDPLQSLRRGAPSRDGGLSRSPASRPGSKTTVRLLVRGPTVFSGYWERPAATAQSFSDGWFRTGDLGVVEDGYVRLLGRSTDLIISGGYNVYPAEVEDVLLGHPSVAEVAVTGAPSDEWGEVVCAWVVPDGWRRAPTSMRCSTTRRSASRPTSARGRVQFVDCVAAQPMGKVRRSELR